MTDHRRRLALWRELVGPPFEAFLEEAGRLARDAGIEEPDQLAELVDSALSLTLREAVGRMVGTLAASTSHPANHSHN